MLNRQKILIRMIQEAGRCVRRIELTKWCFLLSREAPSRGGKSFYQFLPYHYGPFSFCLQREADSLARDGYLNAVDEKTWDVFSDAVAAIAPLPASVCRDTESLVRRFRDFSTDYLIDYVYRRYPGFTVNSKLKKLRPRPVATVAVYTAGYEGLLVDGFLDLLIRSGVRRIVDVRSNPVARRYGFHKSTLNRLCGLLDLEYVHIPELGIEPRYRRNLNGPDDYEVLFARYKAGTLARETDLVVRVAEMVTDAPSCLLCMEADPRRCHRTRLAEAVSAITELPITHLGTIA